jgi:hypothetical protein
MVAKYEPKFSDADLKALEEISRRSDEEKLKVINQLALVNANALSGSVVGLERGQL